MSTTDGSCKSVSQTAVFSRSETVARLVLDKVFDTDLQGDLGRRLIKTTLSFGPDAITQLSHKRGARITLRIIEDNGPETPAESEPSAHALGYL